MTAIETAPAPRPPGPAWLSARGACPDRGLPADRNAVIGAGDLCLEPHHRLSALCEALVSVKLALDPLIAATALMFAVRGRLREAILALAAFVVVGWLLNDLWSFPSHGFELSLDFGGFIMFVRHFAFLAAAIAGAALAVKNRRLSPGWAAGLLPDTV